MQIENIKVFYAARQFITAFNGASHWTLFWDTSVQSTPLRAGPPTWVFLLDLSTKILYAFLISSLCATYLSLIYYFDSFNNIFISVSLWHKSLSVYYFPHPRVTVFVLSNILCRPYFEHKFLHGSVVIIDRCCSWRRIYRSRCFMCLQNTLTCIFFFVYRPWLVVTLCGVKWWSDWAIEKNFEESVCGLIQLLFRHLFREAEKTRDKLVRRASGNSLLGFINTFSNLYCTVMFVIRTYFRYWSGRQRASAWTQHKIHSVRSRETEWRWSKAQT